MSMDPNDKPIPAVNNNSPMEGRTQNMSRYLPFSTGMKAIKREGYDQWVQPAGLLDDDKDFYNCNACGLYKSFHRPEYCPALKTNSKYANGLWRESSWDALPGTDCCRVDYSGLGYAPKMTMMGTLCYLNGTPTKRKRKEGWEW